MSTATWILRRTMKSSDRRSDKSTSMCEPIYLDWVHGTRCQWWRCWASSYLSACGATWAWPNWKRNAKVGYVILITAIFRNRQNRNQNITAAERTVRPIQNKCTRFATNLFLADIFRVGLWVNRLWKMNAHMEEISVKSDKNDFNHDANKTTTKRRSGAEEVAENRRKDSCFVWFFISIKSMRWKISTTKWRESVAQVINTHNKIRSCVPAYRLYHRHGSVFACAPCLPIAFYHSLSTVHTQ